MTLPETEAWIALMQKHGVTRLKMADLELEIAPMVTLPDLGQLAADLKAPAPDTKHYTRPDEDPDYYGGGPVPSLRSTKPAAD